MKISASIFASDDPNEYVCKLSETNIDYLHLDIMLKNDIEKIKVFNKYKIPLDVHLVCEEITEDTIETLNDLSVKILSIQYENLKNINQTMDNLKKFKNDIGMAIIPGTNYNNLLQYKNIIKHILIMCCDTPGISGGKFIESSYNYIEDVKKIFPQTPIYVDGGINKERIRLMKDKNIDIVVMGTYLYKNKNQLQKVINELKIM